MEYDIVILGAGSAGLSLGYLLEKNGINNFMIFDYGKDIDNRDHNDAFDAICGEGGAGLFSDGKFSFFPSGTKVWQLNQKYTNIAYTELKNIFAPHLEITTDIKDKNALDIENDTWILKEYQSLYLDLDTRIELIKNLSKNILHKIKYETSFRNISKTGDKFIVTIEKDSVAYDITCKDFIIAGGRFSPLLFKNTFVPSIFRRIEVGARVVGDSTHKLFNVSSLTDPKFIMSKDEVEYRTFCWCREGEIVKTLYKIDNNENTKFITHSGRADCNKSSQSNFGFNIKFKTENYMNILDKIINTSPFDVEINSEFIELTSIIHDIMPKEVSYHITNGLNTFATTHNISLKELKIIGPTIEGIGYYPDINNFLQVNGNENMWVVGDASGIFRGIIASMQSGLYVGFQLIDKYLKN